MLDINFLQQYLRINTAHPFPNYRDVLRLFSQQAEKDGFKFFTVQLPSRLPILVISYEGSDPSMPSLVLNHHMDVVPADISQWSKHPFSGAFENDTIFGRGVQDMKGVGFVHYEALKKIKEAGIKLKRTVHLLLVPHEEIGGFEGLGQFIETEEFEKLRIGFVLDEGLPSSDESRLKIKVSERKAMQIKFTSRGDTSHGSRLHCMNALHELVLCLAQIAQFQKKQQKIVDQPPGLLISANITSLNAGVMQQQQVAINVVPGIAMATLDIRVPSSMSIDQARLFIDDIIKDFPGISYVVHAQVKERPYTEHSGSFMYETLEKAINKNNIQAEPYFAEETTDLRFYEEKGIEGLGFTPFLVQANIHGVDECVRISDLELGVAVFFDFLKAFCLEEV